MSASVSGHGSRPLLALVSAVPAAIPPTRAAFDAHFPEAELWNIVDDRLLQDADIDGGVSDRLAARMTRLIQHAVIEGADGILLTCSMYGPVAHAVSDTMNVPVLGPDDAVFAATAEGGYRDVVVVSSATEPLADSMKRIRAALPESVGLRGVVTDRAAAAARAGDTNMVGAHIIRAVEESGARPDAIVLGQYSLAPASSAIQDALGMPVLAGPQFAVKELRRRIEETRS